MTRNVSRTLESDRTAILNPNSASCEMLPPARPGSDRTLSLAAAPTVTFVTYYLKLTVTSLTLSVQFEAAPGWAGGQYRSTGWPGRRESRIGVPQSD
eukprot:755599-Hanusia_phi.AAC.1